MLTARTRHWTAGLQSSGARLFDRQCQARRGLSAGDYRRDSDPRLQGENYRANVRAAAAVHALAAAKGVSAAQLALAWVLAQGEDVVPIPGTKRRAYLKQNLAAASVQLSDSERQQLDHCLAPGAVAGERYPAAVMADIDR